MTFCRLCPRSLFCNGLCIECYHSTRNHSAIKFPHYRLLTLSDDALYVTVSGATSFMLTTHKKDQISVFSDPAFVNVTRSRIAPAIAVEMLQEIERRILTAKGEVCQGT